MRLLLILLLVSSILADEKVTSVADKKGETKTVLKKSVDDSKSKTGKRDSSDQTSSFGINPNDEPFKPMLNSPAPFEAAASDTQQVYYDKNQRKAAEGAGNAKSDTNPQAANSYRPQYTQVPHQQPSKNHLRLPVKNVVIQQQPQQQQHNHPNILYAVPQNPAYHYERIPQQHQQQQQPLQISAPPPPPLPLPAQRGPQKPVQYVIAIPMSYLRQLQQQFVHQQQAQQQPQPQQPLQQTQQVQMIPVYSITGPLARDNHGSYRPFHRFAPAAVNDVSNGATHQTGSAPPLAPQPLISAAPASPGYVTQYVQIPASVLLAAAQMAQAQQQQQQQQQRPIQLPQSVYSVPQHQQQQPMIQLQLQQPLNQQHAQTQSPQLYYYQPQQQHQQQQVPLKPSQPLPTLASPPPVYAINVNQLQPQPTQQHQTYQPLPDQQQQQQQQPINVGKQQQLQQPHRVRGVRPTANFKPSQYDNSAVAYENDGKAQLVTFQAPAHINLNTHSHTNAHSQQYIAPSGPVAQQQQQSAPTHQQVVQAQAPEAYEQVTHYNPQYVQHHLGQQQPQQLRQHQPHRLQIQSQQHVPLVEHINNLPFSQAIQGPTPLPFLRLQPAAGVTPFFPPALPHSFLSGSFQPPFSPLGTPSKVTSFTNVLLQPFAGHPPSFSSAEIAASGPFMHQNGGVRYATHVYHPPTSATSLLAANNKHHNSAVVSQLHPAPRVLNTAGDVKVSAASAKADIAVAASPTIVKYP